MSSRLHIKYGWLRALVFFFVAMLMGGLIASFIFEGIYRGLFGGTNNGQPSLLFIFISYIINQIGVLACLWIFRKSIDGLPIFSLGLNWKGFTKDAYVGFGVAILTISAGTILMYFGNNLTLHTEKFDLLNTLVATFLFILVAFIEEIVVRGYVLNNLMQSMNRWLALFISALLFSLMHKGNPDITLVAQVNIFIAGILLGVNYIYTKNLWFAIFFHFAWNFFQGVILGYHVSGMSIDSGLFSVSTTGPEEITGGIFGFEGSIFAAILQVIAIISLAIYYEKIYGKRLVNVKSKKVEPTLESENIALED